MATEYKLTWREKEQRWRKIYKGKELYFPGTGGKKASYPAAWKAFQQEKLKIESELVNDKNTDRSSCENAKQDFNLHSKEFLLQWKDHLSKKFWKAINQDDGFRALAEAASLEQELIKICNRLNSICGVDTHNVLEAIGLCDQNPKYTLFELCQAACFNRSETQ